MKNLIARFKRWMLNKEARKDGEKITEVLGIRKGWNVTDFGTGGGHFIFLFAEHVGPDGHVYAVDTDEKLLKFIKEEATEQNLKQIECVHTKKDVPELPQQSLDLAFFRDVYHHLKLDRALYFKNFKKLLKPGGKVVIIDYKPKGWHRIFGHSSDPSEIRHELGEAGYTLVEDHGFLPKQSFQVYK